MTLSEFWIELQMRLRFHILHYLFQAIEIFDPGVRHLIRQQPVCDNADAPYINFVVIGLLVNYFWGHISWGAA